MKGLDKTGITVWTIYMATVIFMSWTILTVPINPSTSLLSVPTDYLSLLFIRLMLLTIAYFGFFMFALFNLMKCSTKKEVEKE